LPILIIFAMLILLLAQSRELMRQIARASQDPEAVAGRGLHPQAPQQATAECPTAALRLVRGDG